MKLCEFKQSLAKKKIFICKDKTHWWVWQIYVNFSNMEVLQYIVLSWICFQVVALSVEVFWSASAPCWIFRHDFNVLHVCFCPVRLWKNFYREQHSFKEFQFNLFVHNVHVIVLMCICRVLVQCLESYSVL